jgi:hypothetical protein
MKIQIAQINSDSMPGDLLLLIPQGAITFSSMCKDKDGREICVLSVDAAKICGVQLCARKEDA